jgi:membrane protein YdbS with pleckstrin-like domain
MRYLALILFLPWFAIVAFAYWHLPRDLPRPVTRRGFDWGAIALAMAVALIGALAAMDMPWRHAGKIWPQVAAVLFSYAAFLLLMLIAALLRHRIWR